MSGKSRKQKEVDEILRITSAEIIREKAVCIGRSKELGAVTPGDIKGIRMLPADRIYCTACGVPLYVGIGKNNKAIQVADPMPVSGSDCKHLNRGVPRRLDGR